MFSFLNSGILPGILAVFIPFIIHFLAKRRVKPVLFSSLYFLKQIQSQTIRRVNIKQWLLLLLRVLAILCLVLTFARPALKGIFKKANTKSTSVLVIDQSMSMMRKKISSEVLVASSTLLNEFQSSDELMLYETETNMQASEWKSPDTIKRKVQRTPMVYGHHAFTTMLESGIRALTEKTEVNKEIFIISDFHQAAYIHADTSHLISGYKGQLYLIRQTGENQNLTVYNFKLVNQIIEMGRPLILRCLITNFGKMQVKDQLFRLFHDDEAVAQQLISLEPGGKSELLFTYIPKKAGWQKLYVNVDMDDFPYDNQAYLSFYIPEIIRVLLVGHSYDDINPVSLVLESKNKSNGFSVEHITESERWQQNLEDYDVVILSNLSELSSQQSHLLLKYIKNGGGVLFFPGNQSRPDIINRLLLEPLGNIQFAEFIGRQTNDNGYFTLRKPDINHPLFKSLFQENQSLFNSPELYRIITWNGPDQSVLRLNTGEPIMQEIIYGKGKLLISGMGLGRDWSNLPISTFFAPLIHCCSVYLSSNVEKVETFETGQAVTLVSQEFNPNMPCKIIQPDGLQQIIYPVAKIDNTSLFIKNTPLPGFYEIYQQELKYVLSVNVPVTESDFHVNEEELSAFFPSSKVKHITESNNIHQTLIRSRYGRELWKEILILALLFLMAETFLTKYNRSVDKK